MSRSGGSAEERRARLAAVRAAADRKERVATAEEAVNAVAAEGGWSSGDQWLVDEAQRVKAQFTSGELKPLLFDKTGLRTRAAALAVAEYLGGIAVRKEGDGHRLFILRQGKGVYTADRSALMVAMVAVFGDRYRPTHTAAVADAMVADAVESGRLIREFGQDGWINLRNGWLHVLSGQFKTHEQAEELGWCGDVQLSVDWEPDAQCPYYERWAAERVGDQLALIEEASSIVFAGDDVDVMRPTLFCYGPSRSGKSTWLRIMNKLVGKAGCSAVSLHQLASNRFMAAHVHGKILNTAGDLSSRHIDDTSVWKMLSGEDTISAEHKGGHPFDFYNRALFAFSANDPPTVSEASNAYLARITPVKFGNSFQGHESLVVEKRLLVELPGIFRRWIEALRRLAARGQHLAVDTVVSKEFAKASDRITQWVDDHCIVNSAEREGVLLDDHLVTGSRAAFRAFMEWAREGNGRATMREQHFIKKLATLDGVYAVRSKSTKSRGWNITVKIDGLEYVETDE